MEVYELNEAKKILEEIWTSKGIDANNETIIKVRKTAVETVFQELENKDNEIKDLKALNAMQECRIDEMDIPKKYAERLIENINSKYLTKESIKYQSNETNMYYMGMIEGLRKLLRGENTING